MTEAFLTTESTAETLANGELGPRNRVLTAGSLMTSVFNGFIILSLGIRSTDAGVEAGEKADAI